jgi:PAS domain S-box-containing protein
MFSEHVSDHAFITFDAENRIVSWSRGAERILGYSEAEILGQPGSVLFTPEDRSDGEVENELATARREGCAEHERWYIRRDGTRFWGSGVMIAHRDSHGNPDVRGFAKVLRDETERKQAEDRLKRALQEKELLLREIHHRVKNNLQVITTLVSLESDQVQDRKIERIFNQLQHRVRAIAALHETLYSSRDLANVDFGPYMRQLLNDLVGFYSIDRERVQVRMESDDVVLSVEQALLLGLIVNELVSNALKHAFPGERSGAIDVHFHYLAASVQQGKRREPAWCELSVRDDGAGINDADGIWQRSMGLRIVHLLTEQLHGTLSLDQLHSTRFSVRFPREKFERAAEAHHSSSVQGGVLVPCL